MKPRWQAIIVLVASTELALALSGCADQPLDQTSYYYSDLPTNGHSSAYTYPTDITRSYRTYPAFSELGPIYTPERSLDW